MVSKREREYTKENAIGSLHIKVIRGVNLAIRDLNSSDPYVIFCLSNQKVRTSIIKKSLNPIWNEELTIFVLYPNEPVTLNVYDHDTFSQDDNMGNAEFDIRPLIDAVNMNLKDLPNGTIIKTVQSNRNNCLSEESRIVWTDGQVVQKMFLRLRNVECGEIELQIHLTKSLRSLFVVSD